jgi:hypothetical protein
MRIMQKFRGEGGEARQSEHPHSAIGGRGVAGWARRGWEQAVGRGAWGVMAGRDRALPQGRRVAKSWRAR